MTRIPPWRTYVLNMPRVARSPRDRERRASGLLRSFLTEEQWWGFRSGRDIEIRGSRGGYYRISPALQVRRLRLWRWPVEYCIAAPWEYPYGDRALALILMIQTDERLFRRTAVRINGWLF